MLILTRFVLMTLGRCSHTAGQCLAVIILVRVDRPGVQGN